jgi:hypothetical protein
MITSPNDSHRDFFEFDYDETTGELRELYIPLISESRLIKEAWDGTYKAVLEEVGKEARELLKIFQEITTFLNFSGIDFDYLPSLQLFNVDDGSILIEWIFGNFRVGFSIEPDLEESSWYLVSKKDMGGINASGYLSNIDRKSLFLWLLYFVGLHY